MTGLLGAELRRLAWRRSLHLLVVAGLLLLAALGFSSLRSMRPPTAAQMAANQRAYEVAAAEWRVHGAEAVRQCQQDSADAVARGDQPIDCTDLAPRPEAFAASPHRVTELTGGLPLGMALGTGLMCVLGAAVAVGSEFEARAMATLLLAEPRRGRVYAAKVLAVGVASTALVVVALALATVGAGMVGAAAHADMTMGTREVATYLARGGRVLLLVPVAAMACAGLAFVVRSTATTVVTVLVAVVASTLLATTRYGRWALLNNVEAWVDGRSEYYWTSCGGPEGCDHVVRTIGLQQAGLSLAVLCAGLLLAGLVAFRRRDVA